MGDERSDEEREEILRLREENLRLREEGLKSRATGASKPPPIPPPQTFNITQKNESCLAGCGTLVFGSLGLLFLISQCSGGH